jgi:segregation and condensation protein B
MLDQLIEAILFAAAKPFTIKRLAEVTDADADDVKTALDALERRLASSGSGIQLQRNGHEVELVTRPEMVEVVSKVVQSETQGELTRASLETLTILAYRGPMTRPELEQIRGVHSSLILRNLLLRGLIEQKEDDRLGQPVYAVTFEFLNHLGLTSVEALPDYMTLHGHASVNDVLKQLDAAPVTKAESMPPADSSSLSV